MRTGRPPKALPAAIDWLKAYLSGGARTSDEVKQVGLAQGFSWCTVRRSKEFLGIESKRQGHGWVWLDPAVAVPESELTTREVLEELKQTIQTTNKAAVPLAVDSDAIVNFDSWDEETYESASLLDLVDYGTELSEDLREATKYHGTKQSYREGLGSKTKSYKVDNAPKIQHLKKQIKRTTEWIARKSSFEQPVEVVTEQPSTSV